MYGPCCSSRCTDAMVAVPNGPGYDGVTVGRGDVRRDEQSEEGYKFSGERDWVVRGC